MLKIAMLSRYGKLKKIAQYSISTVIMIDKIEQYCYNSTKNTCSFLGAHLWAFLKRPTIQSVAGDWSAKMGNMTWFANLTTAERLEQSLIDEREITTALLFRSLTAATRIARLFEPERRFTADAAEEARRERRTRHRT
ncbi:MAG: hypothetical protein M1482_04925 [Chloroflexi bacterium]|nr:hypothetical protein [Chloroflexota bacterium]